MKENSLPYFLWYSVSGDDDVLCLGGALETFATVKPDLDRVDDVLPKDIAAWANRGEGTEKCGGNPDGEGGVLLPETLAGFDCPTKIAADEATCSKLNKTEY